MAHRMIAVAIVAACGGAPRPSPSSAPSSQPAAQPAQPPASPTQHSPKFPAMFTLDECDQVEGTAQAAALYQKACTAHDSESCDRLAALYTCGKGVGRDAGRAMELEASACELDDIDACGNVAMAMSVPEATLAPARVMKLAEKGCAAHQPLACAGIGLMYLEGWGVTADPAKAVAILDDVCTKQGYAMACANVAWLAYAGIGMEKNVERATTLAESACAAGMPSACNTLGGILVERNGPGDARRAAALFAQLCDGGAAASCDNLGQLYRNGLGDVAADLDRAKTAFDRACKAENPPACRHLAELVSK
jgi:uncharacterized protein